MRFSEFRRHSPPGGNVYIFICEDEFLIDESRGVWAGVFGGDWDFSKVSVREFEALEASELLVLARTPPLFGPPRALLVTNAGKITKKKIAVLEELAGLEESFLKVIVSAPTRRSVSALAKTFPKVEIDPPRAGEAARWLRDRYGVTPDVANYVVDNIGTELQQLRAEMEKLQTYVREARPIEIRDVDELILRSEQYGPFELDDALQARDYPKAVRVLGAMLDEGVQPILILSRIARVWRRVLIGKFLEGRASSGQIAAAASVPHWKATQFAVASGRFDRDRIVTGFAELLRADRAFKTSSPNAEIYLDMLLWKLMR